jgi:hypothetical protein
MSNQDKLHIWWWGNSGPANEEPLTIGQINTALQPALVASVVSGKQGNKISKAGWNYAVLKFLIEKCTLPVPVNAVLVANANPKNGNYSVWRKHLNVRASVNPLNALRSNDIMPSNSLSASNVANKNTLKKLIANLQKIIMHNGIDKGSIENSIKALSDMGFQYDDKKFPALASCKLVKLGISNEG